MSLPITYLFVPGNRPERFDKALNAGAGAVIIDLEDAVAAADKANARAAIAAWFAAQQDQKLPILVRINDVQSAEFNADLAFLHTTGITQVMLPKTESPEQIAKLIAATQPEMRIVPLIETALGVANVAAIATAKGAQRLAFGTLDYALDLDLSDDPAGLAYPASQIAIASRCAQLPPPIGGVTPAIDDAERIRAEFAWARAYGFAAKLCIHPKQVAIVHQACRPTEAEQNWAERVLAAVAATEDAVQIDGKMVDRPVVLKAQAIMSRVVAGQGT